MLEKAKKLIAAFLENKSWEDAIEEAVDNNLLQFSSAQPKRRAERETCTRLKSLRAIE